MKVKTPTEAIHATVVKEGDTVLCGVTHEILINGDKAWIKFEASTTVGADESAKQAKDRIVGYVSDAVIDAAKVAAQAVEGAEIS